MKHVWFIGVLFSELVPFPTCFQGNPPISWVSNHFETNHTLLSKGGLTSQSGVSFGNKTGHRPLLHCLFIAANKGSMYLGEVTRFAHPGSL